MITDREIINLKEKVEKLEARVLKLEKTPESNPPTSPNSEEKKLYTEKELYSMNKSQQIEILNSLGIAEIPKLEKDRVELILNIIKLNTQ